MSIHSDETRQNAFVVWCGEGEQSATKTARLCGIGERTVFSWMRADEWRQRWLSSSAPESEVAAAQGKTMVRYAMPLVAKRLITIIGGEKPLRNAVGDIVTDDAGHPVMVYEAEHKDAVNAAKLLALYGWGSPLSATDVTDGSYFATSYSAAPDAPGGDPGRKRWRSCERGPVPCWRRRWPRSIQGFRRPRNAASASRRASRSCHT